VKRLLSISCIGIAAMLSLLWGSPAQANEWNEQTYFTFTAPFELPGVALAPGTYLFKHPDLPSNQHVVQVFSEDGKTIYGTFLTIPLRRPSPSSEPSVMFQETAKGAPEALEAWFYPGRVIGDEFVYLNDASRQTSGVNGN
jgi:hypothetical protein